jgi:hypothetical protein
MIFMTVYGSARADTRTLFFLPRARGCGVAEGQRSQENSSNPFTRERINRISATEPQHRFRVMGADMYGTIRPQQKIDTVFLAAYFIVIATAAIVILIHPKPELIPLLLWYAGHPL